MIASVRAARTTAGVTVSWDHDESGPPINFELQAQPDGGEWATLGTVEYVPGTTAYSYTHGNPAGTGIRYQVRAVNEAGASPWEESNRVPLVVVPNATPNVVASV